MAKPENWMKVAALAIFGFIVLIMCIPVATGVIALGASHTAVVSVAVFGIIVVTLSDRIISLTISKGQLKVQLAELKRGVKETIKLVRSDVERQPVSASASEPAASQERAEEHAKLVEQLAYAESLIEKEANQQSIPELVKDAQNIGKAMGVLRETMQSCHKEN
jgi:hypothetical protein